MSGKGVGTVMTAGVLAVIGLAVFNTGNQDDKMAESTVISSLGYVTESSMENDGGGSPNATVNLTVTVEVDEYFYNNASISFEELIKTIQKQGDNVIVSIKDNNSSHKTYDKLIAKLGELGIKYEEKD